MLHVDACGHLCCELRGTFSQLPSVPRPQEPLLFSKNAKLPIPSLRSSYEFHMQHLLHSLKQILSRLEPRAKPKRGAGSLLMGPHLGPWASFTLQSSFLSLLLSYLTGKLPVGCHLDLPRWADRPHGLRAPVRPSWDPIGSH